MSRLLNIEDADDTVTREIGKTKAAVTQSVSATSFRA